MKRLLLCIAGIMLLSALSSCKKKIDKRKEDYVLAIMVNGSWFLENYTENGIDNTADFKDHVFKFYEGERVEAISSMGTENGRWIGNVNNLTLTINFSTSPQLKRLNYVWQFLDSHIGLVFAETITSTGKITIRLRRKV